jgi:hypothetical protein
MAAAAESVKTEQLAQLQSYNVDYSLWERRHSPTSSSSTSNHKLTLASSSTTCSVHGRITVQPSCHPRPSDKLRLATVKAAKLAAAEQLIQNERIKLLRLQVSIKRQMLEESLKREADILEDNLRLKDVLEFNEKEAHEGIKQLLRKYERFRGGMNNISSKFAADVADTEEKLEAAHVQMTAEINKMENDLKAVEDQLRCKQIELDSLRNYSDKEKPANAMKIVELTRKIEILKAEHSKEISELQRIVELDKEKTEKAQLKALDSVRVTLAKSAVQQIESSTEDIAVHNKRLQQEIGAHQAEIRRLEETNKALRQEVRQMLRDPRMNVRQTMFPELYPSVINKCTPDIPVHEWLPI